MTIYDKYKEDVEKYDPNFEYSHSNALTELLLKKSAKDLFCEIIKQSYLNSIDCVVGLIETDYGQEEYPYRIKLVLNEQKELIVKHK